MKGSRTGKTFKGSHEYQHDGYLITLMGNGMWIIFDRDGCEGGNEVPSPDFKTLTAARKWLKSYLSNTK